MKKAESILALTLSLLCIITPLCACHPQPVTHPNDTAEDDTMTDTNAHTTDGSDTGETNVILVTEKPYGAVGDGKTCDRAAIQAAIDDSAKAGGGTVILPAGKTFLTGCLILRNNVELHFENGAVLVQSNDTGDYIQYTDGQYLPYTPIRGGYKSGDIAWNHAWYYNYPLIYAPEGTENVRITGNGTIHMVEHTDCDSSVHMTPVGFYRTSHFVISDITIDGYCAYAVMTMLCDHGLISDVTVKNPRCTNCDGIHMMNCQHMRVTGCDITSGDDCLYIISEYNDPRGGTWWSGADPMPCTDFEIDHNRTRLTWSDCKGFCFILWGDTAPDKSEVEVKNIYIHDNDFESYGIWTGMYPYDPGVVCATPVKNIRWENNKIHTLKPGTENIPMSGTNYPRSMSALQNNDFTDGECWWMLSDEESISFPSENNNTVARLVASDDKEVSICEGLSLTGGVDYRFSMTVRTEGSSAARLFIREYGFDTILAAKEISSSDPIESSIDFTPDGDGNYCLGVMAIGSGTVYADDAVFGYAGGRGTIFGNASTTDFTDDSAYELGTLFSVTTSGTVGKVRLYSGADECGTHVVRIWNADTGVLLAGPYNWEFDAGFEGWRTYDLPDAVPLEKNVKYIVSISNSSDHIYARGISVFNAPLLGSEIVTYTGSGVYTTELGTMPNLVYNNTAYYRDIVFSPD